MNKYYLRIEDNDYGFIVDGIYDILSTDIEITNEDYNKFFELQSQGKQFRLKKIPTGNRLFDLIEEYTQEQLPVQPSELELLQEEMLNQSEFMLDMDFRITSLELGL